MIIELTYSGKGAAHEELMRHFEEYGSRIEFKEYDNGRDIDIIVREKDPNKIALRLFTTFLNHSDVHDMRFKRR